MQPFAHLHVHTEYSLLDGYSRIKQLVKQAKLLGMDHLAITDHGVMYGVVEFYKACREEGVHPILGTEAYLARNINDRSQRGKKDYSHLLLLAKNNVGYRNLLKLATIAGTEGVHDNRPRIDKSLLEKYGDGLIATSSCLAGEIPQMLIDGNVEQARKTIRWYQDLLGRENFFLEIQEHQGRENGRPSPQGEVNKRLYDLHKALGVPLIATNDLHYVQKSDADAHDVLLCVQTGRSFHDPKRWRFDSHHYWLKSPAEMAQLFPELPSALSNTVELVAEQCLVDPVDPFAIKAALPKISIPAGYRSQSEYMYDLCLKGAKERYGEVTDAVKGQLDYEFRIIEDKGFVPYFLIVGEAVLWARSRGIRCSARGSAAGCILAYTLGITNVDPIRYQLPFERFFNVDRADMPDIDLDIQDSRRSEFIAHIEETYGRECVAQMVTFNRLAAKASVKDAARTLERQSLGDQMSRLIRSQPGMTLEVALKEEKDLRDLCQNNAQAREIMQVASRLEGCVRSTGTHAAGVVVGNVPLDEIVPLRLKDYKDPTSGRETQFEQAHLEELGLIKFDFLGLANLTILDNTVKLIKSSRDEDIVLEQIPLDHVQGNDDLNAKRKQAFALLSEGRTTGIFQLEGAKMTEYIKQLKPSRVEDVMAMIALYRPGPMDSIPEFIRAKHGRKKVTYLDPRLAEWLEESYGVIVYQDQVLFIAVNLAGFSWGKVNKFRKALSKKKMDEVEGYKGDFIRGCVKKGMAEDVASQLFSLILPFGGYGFNKAHAASYAVIAFYSAFLKANYAPQFLAAMLTTESQGSKATKKVPLAVAECKRMGVCVLGPDINRSQADFSVENEAVRFGLRGIRGVGSKLVDEIIRERATGGPFTSLTNVYSRLSREMTKGTLETLVKVGALDAFGERHRLLASIDDAIRWVNNEQAAKQRGLLSLFDQAESAFSFSLKGQVEPLTNEQVLEWEKEHLLTYISGHPLDRYEVALAARCSHTTATVSEESNRQKVTLGGMIVGLRRFTTRAGKTMVVARLEDLVGSIEVLVFSNVFEQSQDLWREGTVVTIQGEVKAEVRGDQENDEVSIICRHAEALEHNGVSERYRVSFTIVVSGDDPRSRSNDIIRLHKLFQLIRDHPGQDRFDLFVDDVPVEVDGQRSYAHVSLSVKEGLDTIKYTPALHREAVALLGDDSVRVQVVRNRESVVA